MAFFSSSFLFIEAGNINIKDVWHTVLLNCGGLLAFLAKQERFKLLDVSK